jgi:hypothetical protein
MADLPPMVDWPERDLTPAEGPRRPLIHGSARLPGYFVVMTSQRAEGLRERKKAETRQRLSDTATRMFLDRGFDGVKVTEIAAACQVSEKTVYNYFPTKEALVLDRWKATAQALRAARAIPACPRWTRPSRSWPVSSPA